VSEDVSKMTSIRALERFPRTLRQRDQALGCIPMSIQAVLTYHNGVPPVVHVGGQARSLDEGTILEIFSSHEDPFKICFSAVKQYVLDPFIGYQFASTVEDLPDFDSWRALVVAQVERNMPPLISYASPGGSHIGAVVEATEVGFKVHDPGIGDFVLKPFGELLSIRRHDILRVEPIASSSA
jgi:hypothetical protein